MVFKKILVINVYEFIKRKHLFETLSAAYKIRFSPDYSVDEADGIIAFNDDIRNKYNKPTLFYYQEGEPYIVKKNIKFKNAKLDGINYSNKTIYTDSIVINNALANFKEDEIIAEQEGMVIWAKKEYEGVNHYYSVISPRELSDHENLKHLFFSGDIISTLPLIVFIREIIKKKGNLQEEQVNKPAAANIPLLERIVDNDILFSAKGENFYHTGASSVTMDLISEQKLNPPRYFNLD
jgi:hypothetical protein